MSVIGIDTSNYTTSIAFFDGVGGENCSKLLPVKQGELGLRQSDAVFSHIKSLPELSGRLFSHLQGKKITAVGVSTRPRAVEGSYMPCFMVGFSHAKMLSDMLGVPLIEVSHQQGHVAASLWSAGRLDLMEQPHLAWHLSGGTTELLLVEPEGKNVKCTKIGGTTDISAGQLIDRTGQLLDLPFPAGKHLDALSKEASMKETFKVKCSNMEFSLSGVQNKVQQFHAAHENGAETAAYALRCVAKAVYLATEQAMKAYPGLRVVFSGGVASNSMLRQVAAPLDPIFSQPQFSTDNAMGVAVLAHRAMEGNMAQNVLSITQLNEYIRGKMDNDPLLTQVAVRGEISNYKLYPSGHHYFTLKDEGGALKCVMFKGNAMRLRFRPENGMKVIAMGRVTVFPRDGAYQLYCTAMAMDGVGDLYAAFEQLKKKLAAQGLFDPAHKKPLPRYPGTIGIVTSSAGAAVHDMLRILRKRYPLSRVRLLPVRVQGAEAPGEIAAAIGYANHFKLADLLIVGRGGGSIEDLWAFNDERVAWAIYRSEIPVISAVGHEPDVTIADFVADLRAATPSNAAELAVPDREALLQTLDGMNSAMASSLQRQLKAARQHLDVLSRSPALRSPTGYIEQRQKNLELLKNRLISAQNDSITRHNHRYIAAVSKLDAMSPLKVLTRGYSMAQKEDGTVLRSVAQAELGERITISLSDGSLAATVMKKESAT